MHHPRERPSPWNIRKQSAARWKWAIPFVAVEWMWEWAAYLLSNWSFLEVLDYLGTFSILVAVIFYFSESGDRIKQRHYQAWQVINTAQGKGGSGGRIEALQELNADKVPLVGVDVSSAFLQGLDLHGANLMRSDFSSADLRTSNFDSVDLTLSNLNSANFRNAHLNHAKFIQADLRNADLTGSSLVGADFSGAVLDDCDLSHGDLNDIAWQQIKSVKGANIAAVKDAPAGFIAWAMSHGAVDSPVAEQ
ncbi:MAG: pentapeptide repeat-containing protein [Terracidiphilus sp.]